ncbi:alpha/beta hydrolase fold domain-containing protein [Actinomadura viridis]|uniref:alpha/beta hydrolase fold domain-containing protein n=1 Tax=Actinomadura viridis TaxID=58110 RepID=UPI00369BF54B
MWAPARHPYAAPARAPTFPVSPTYVATADFDPLRDEAIEYALRMLRARRGRLPGRSARSRPGAADRIERAAARRAPPTCPI